MNEVSVYALALGETEIFKLVLFAFSIGFWVAVIFLRSKIKYLYKLENRRMFMHLNASFNILAALASMFFYIMSWYYFHKDDYESAIFYMLIYISGIITINERKKK